MKLLYVTAGLPLCRGEAFIIPEILELRRQGHDVTVAPVRPYGSVIHDDARQLLAFSVSEPLLSFTVLWSAVVELARHPLRTAAAALALLLSRSVLVLVKNLAVFPKGLWLARLAAQAHVEHIHAHWASTSATAALVAARVARIPWSLTAHRWDIGENNLLEAKARSASFVRAISTRGCNELRRFVGPWGSKLVVIHMGVLLPEEEVVSRVPPTASLRVLMAAFFVEVKGHRYALDAVARLRARGIPVHLDLAGVGPIQAEIQSYATEIGVSEYVRFLGMVSHAELLEGLRSGAWDVALLPSIVADDGAEEGIPVFLMEAMASKVAVVAADTGAISELVRDAGMLVHQRDSGAIADALEHLHREPRFREELAASGNARVREQFAMSASVASLVRLFTTGTAPARRETTHA